MQHSSMPSVEKDVASLSESVKTNKNPAKKQKTSEASEIALGWSALYHELRQNVWCIHISVGNQDNQENIVDSTAMAFPIKFNSDILLMTTARMFPKSDQIRIYAWSLGNKSIIYECNIYRKFIRWDIAVLKFRNVEEHSTSISCSRLASSGTLKVFEELMCITNFGELQGSGLVGTIAYDCIDDVMIIKNMSTCKEYHPKGFNVNHRYRVLGDAFNANSSSYDPVLAKLDPYVPIIQFYGINGQQEGQRDCLGAPLFNREKEIIGMYAGYTSFDVGIHVSALKYCMKVIKKLERKERKKFERKKRLQKDKRRGEKSSSWLKMSDKHGKEIQGARDSSMSSVTKHKYADDTTDGDEQLPDLEQVEKDVASMSKSVEREKKSSKSAARPLVEATKVMPLRFVTQFEPPRKRRKVLTREQLFGPQPKCRELPEEYMMGRGQPAYLVRDNRKVGGVPDTIKRLYTHIRRLRKNAKTGRNWSY